MSLIRSNSLGKFCQNLDGPKIIETDSSSLMIRFRSDGSHSGEFFFNLILDLKI